MTILAHGQSKTRWLCWSVMNAAVLVVFATAAPAAVLICDDAGVLDGDTLKVGVVSIRLHGIDAPEASQRCELPGGGRWSCDEAATDRLSALAEGQEVRCEIRAVDAYGRLVAVCEANGINIGRTLVEEGLAWAFVEYADDYVALEQEARAERLGLWRDGANPQTPWDYRGDRWERAAAASPRPGCPVKGNISGDERIYHTPWSKYYSRTQIDQSAGERWFCDEAEAIEAGWRPARNR